MLLEYSFTWVLYCAHIYDNLFELINQLSMKLISSLANSYKTCESMELNSQYVIVFTTVLK